MVAEKSFTNENELLKYCRALNKNHIAQKHQKANELGISYYEKQTIIRNGKRLKELCVSDEFKAIKPELRVEFQTV